MGKMRPQISQMAQIHNTVGLRFGAAILVAFALTAWGCGGPMSVAGQVPTDGATDAAIQAGQPEKGSAGGDKGSGRSESAEKPAAGKVEHPFPRRLDVPELPAAEGWINTAGPLPLKKLRGKFVILDFWTYCCINCMHILPELKKLERAYPNQLVVIGVHSAKFETEQDEKNILEAVLRHKIEHPVAVDSKHRIWNFFGVRSWPTVLLIDPEGNLVGYDTGEIKFEDYDAILKRAIPYYRQIGKLDEAPLRFELARFKAARQPLEFPGKILADEASGRLFISDSGHHRIVVADLAGKLIATTGSGQQGAGAKDGDFATATFDHPQGMALRGETLYVADTENHLLRKVDLRGKQVTTIAGTGQQARGAWPGMKRDENAPGGYVVPDRFVGKPRATALNSPWDLWIHGTDLYIAMAGPHQIWKMPLDESEIGPFAGNGREDIVDGPLLPKTPYDADFSSFAQPSGLASDGTWLYVADSEGSSIRAVPFDKAKKVATVVGTADLDAGRLFHFGDKDGEGSAVLLQHPLGVAFHGGLLYVADTYNNKVKVVDPKRRTAKTIAGKKDDTTVFDEPAGISYARGKLFVADTNNHRIRTVDLGSGNRVETLAIAGLTPPAAPKTAGRPSFAGAAAVKVAEAVLAPRGGAIALDVRLKLPAGWKINPLAPPSYYVEAGGPTGPVDRAKLPTAAQTLSKPSESFPISVPVIGDRGQETLQVLIQFYYCQDGDAGLCKVGSVVWAVPIRLDAKAVSSSTTLEFEVKP